MHAAPGQLVAVPLQTTVPQDGLPGDPEGDGAQVPAGVDPTAVHCSHAALHADPQQTPSTEKPLAQVFATADAWPFFNPHAPVPLQVDVAGQFEWGSLFASAGLQLPLVPPGACKAAPHAWHVPQPAVPQQTPSTQLFVEHSRQPKTAQSPVELEVPRLQVPPCAFCAWQAPSAPQ